MRPRELRIQRKEHQLRRREQQLRHQEQQVRRRAREVRHREQESRILEPTSDLRTQLISKGYAIWNGSTSTWEPVPPEARVDLEDALVLAAAKGLEEEVKQVILEGADVNFSQMNDNGRQYTALEWAASSGDCQMISTLVDAGADPDKGDDDGKPSILCHQMWPTGSNSTSATIRSKCGWPNPRSRPKFESRHHFTTLQSGSRR